MTYKLAILVAIFFKFTSLHAEYSPDELFSDVNSDKILSFDLVSNFNQIISDTRYIFPDRRTPQVAVINFNQDGKSFSASSMVRARGWDRLKHCELPPLKLDMKRNKGEGNLFSKTKSLKLVTSCFKGNQNEKRRWAMREFIIYKLYEYVTPISYKVRPVYVTYKNNDNSLVWDWNNRDFGFLIENESKMAQRNNLVKKEIPENTGMDWRKVDYYSYLKLSLFQYMLNNTDFGIIDNDIRNIDLVQDKNTGTLYPVPFDFDQAEFVRISKGYGPNMKRWESDGNAFCFHWNSVLRVLPFFKSLRNSFLNEIDKYQRLNYLSYSEAQILKNGILNFYNNMDSGDFKYVVDRTWKKNGCR